MGPYGAPSESHILPISTWVLMVQKLHKVSLDYIHLNILDDMFYNFIHFKLQIKI